MCAQSARLKLDAVLPDEQGEGPVLDQHMLVVVESPRRVVGDAGAGRQLDRDDLDGEPVPDGDTSRRR